MLSVAQVFRQTGTGVESAQNSATQRQRRLRAALSFLRSETSSVRSTAELESRALVLRACPTRQIFAGRRAGFVFQRYQRDRTVIARAARTERIERLHVLPFPVVLHDQRERAAALAHQHALIQ